MKNKKVIRLFTAMLAVVLCMTAFSVTAFAGGGDGDYYTGEPVETTPEPTEEPATGGMEPEGQPLTPEGNATLVDDYYGDKQLITVTTKAGNYFYILIDRANEDKETAVHKRPELFASINGQIVSVPVEPENPLRTAEMTLEDDYGMIDGIINNGRRGEELEKAQAEARRTTPEKKPSIRERLEDAKRECGSRKGPDKPAPQKKPPELGDL